MKPNSAVRTAEGRQSVPAGPSATASTDSPSTMIVKRP